VAGRPVGYGQAMPSTRKLFGELIRPGPHRVLRGDLAFAGLPGVVYTPESGLNLAGVAFGHDWLTGADRYLGLLEHLASWGIVAAAPDTERGLAPSVLNLADDLATALDIVAGVRLGPGRISVHPTKLGVAGHGFGASAAVLAAATRSSRSGFAPKAAPKAVAAVFPAITRPPAEEQAAGLTLPGLVLAAPDDAQSFRSNAAELADAWPGAVLHTVSKAKAGGLAEGRRLTRVVGLPGADRKTQKSVRALLTGYLLYELTGAKAYREFADGDARLPKTDAVDPDADPVKVEDRVVALLKA
jgi:dienelactone hydrolase